MKRLLLGTTSLVASVVLGGVAQAQTANTPVTASVGGQFLFGYGAMVSDDTSPGDAAYHRKFDGFQEDFLVRFVGSTKFDNGWSAGVLVRLRGEETRGSNTASNYSNDTIKDAYIRLKNDEYGEFRFGDDADVRKNKGYYAPQVCDCTDGFFGSNSPNVTFNNGPVGTNATTINFDSRATKAEWYSPTIEGFQLAASYAPDKGRGHRDIGSLNEGANNGTIQGGETPSIVDGTLQDFWSSALSWDGSINDFKLGVETGISGARSALPIKSSTTNNDPFLFDVGGQVGYAGWKFGGAYEQQHGINVNGVYGAAAYRLNPDYIAGSTASATENQFKGVAVNEIVTRTFDIGFTYTTGPITAGVDWSRGIYEGLVNPANIKQTADNDVVFVGGQYLLGPGVNLLGGLQFNNYTPSGAYTPLPKQAALNSVYGGKDPTLNIWAKQYDGVAFIFGTAVRF